MKERAELFQEWTNLTLLIDGERKRGNVPNPAPKFSVYCELRETGKWNDYAAQKWPGDERMRGVANGAY